MERQSSLPTKEQNIMNVITAISNDSSCIEAAARKGITEAVILLITNNESDDGSFIKQIAAMEGITDTRVEVLFRFGGDDNLLIINNAKTFMQSFEKLYVPRSSKSFLNPNFRRGQVVGC